MSVLPMLQVPTAVDFAASFEDDAALFAAGGMTLDALVAKHGGDEGLVLARLADPALAAAVDARAVDVRADGRLARAQAGGLLLLAIERLRVAVDQGQLAAGTLVRIADLAHRVAGIAPLKPEAATPGTNFSVQIILSGDDKRPPPVAEAVEVKDVQ